MVSSCVRGGVCLRAVLGSLPLRALAVQGRLLTLQLAARLSLAILQYLCTLWPVCSVADTTLSVCSLLRSFTASAAAAAEPAAGEAPQRTHFGNLQDQDRIFTNLYGQADPFLKVRQRARWMQARTGALLVSHALVRRAP